jgi:NCS1 family nucleobase:cation symporter-1
MSENAYQENVLEVEPFGIEPIPPRERHGQVSKVFTIWFASSLNVVTWFTGFLGIELGLSLKYAILALVIGNLTGGALLAMTSAAGIRFGQPLIPASRKAFGRAGVIGLSSLNLINNIGWLAVNLVLGVMAMQKIFPLLGYHQALVIMTVATVLIAVYGYNFIHAFAYWMSILMGLVFAAMTVIAAHNLPALVAGAQTAPAGFSPWMFLLTVAIAFSFQISYCPVGSDYTRYLPESTSAGRVWLAAFLGTITACIWLESLGALTATLGLHAGPMDFFARLMGIFAVPALIGVMLSIMPNNVVSVYSGALAALAMGVPLKRWTAALATGGVAALLISFGSGQFADIYKNFLLLLSYWIAPWMGVFLSDYFYRGRASSGDGQGWKGILAFGCGVVVSIPFMSSVLYVGPLAQTYLGGADISYFLSMLVSGAVYLAITSTRKSSLELPRL